MAANASDGAAKMIEWIRTRVELSTFEEAMWTAEHDAVVIEFLGDVSAHRLMMVVYDGALVMEYKVIPPVAAVSDELMYFIRPDGIKLTAVSIITEVQYGMVAGASMDTLLRLMNNIYSPQILGTNNAWPESIKKDFTNHFHKFMCSLTETTHEAAGKTVLYLPGNLTQISENDILSAAKNKDLVQQLEGVVIHWTRQIKQVVNNHDNAYNAEVSGPLEEIGFWRSRTVDLSGISEQLLRGDVRKVVLVLEAAKSSYLARFETLSQRIQEGSVEADNNLRFLESITPQCEALAQAGPKEIPAILPTLLKCIRMIWSLSKFYNTEERLTGLLRKISNEIIHRCRAKISLDDIFDGDVDGSMVSLGESIACGVAWKRIYKRTAAAVAASSSREWKFDDASIFAQIDAFVQRCRDLLEVCEGQIQFARKSTETKGEPGPLPMFGGSRGQEITKALLEIQANFETQIERLRKIQRDDYEILDVKTSKWHDDYNYFKNMVKDYEVMYQNVINTAFDGVSHVSDGVALLEIFYSLAKRDAIRQCVEKKTADVYLLFEKMVRDARHEFDKRDMGLRPNEPQFAGSALWARSLASMVQESRNLLQDAKYLVRPREAEVAEESYNTLMKVLRDYMTNRYYTWNEKLKALDSTNLQSRLDSPLMRRAASTDDASGNALGKSKDSLLECSFDEHLLALFTEVHYWEKFQGEFSIPYVAHDLCNQREKLRVMREHVMLVVRAYNSILAELAPEERRLFSDHIRRLDKRINQGLTKLTWATKGIVEFYVKDCCGHCAETHRIVKRFKAGKESIARTCRLVAHQLLLKLDKNTVYDEAEFDTKQAAHRDSIKASFTQRHESIKETMVEMFQNFKDGSSEVQREWRSLVTQTDRNVELALRQTVKRSLQELSRAINGDAKTEPQTLFRVNIVLENGRVDYRPTMINLTHVVNVVAKEMISTVSVVPRLREVLSTEDKGLEVSTLAAGEGEATVAEGKAEKYPSFYSIIYNDMDMLKILVSIMNGMSSTATELQKYLSYWDKHKPIWEMDKESYIRRYAKANRTLKNYDTDVTKYREQQADIQGEQITHTINFIQIDCTLLKTALSNHCTQWQNKLLGLLNSNAQRELFRLHDKFDSNTTTLRTKPLNLDHLSASINTLKTLQKECLSIEESFQPLEEKYQVLQKFDVQTTDEENLKLTTLHETYETFKEMLVETEKSLDKSKVNMKRDLEANLESYSTGVFDLRSASIEEMPKDSEIGVTKAFDVIKSLRGRVEAVHQRQKALKPGLDIFGIESPDHKELRDTEEDLDLMDQIWTITKDWGNAWDGWKNGMFGDLDVSEMENAAGQYNKSVKKLGRKIGKWPVHTAMTATINQFISTMPLIMDLKNPALRERHWDSLKKEINKDFDPHSVEFTLEQVFALGLHAAAEFIGDLSANANKELAIEQNLSGIVERWNDINIDVAVYKDPSFGYFKVRSTEDLYQVLEDDSVQVSTMKASKFYLSFQKDIDYWENLLSLISEIIDTILTVQRKWMYLESIFMASEDIKKAMPEETKLFVEVNDKFKFIMTRVNKDPNAQRACKEDGMLEDVITMDEKLEKIQKSLDDYLETKRMLFPRFYFVSDDDLLEILGQSRDPIAVQKHIKKCFEGFAKMIIVPVGKAGNRVVQCAGMISGDSEQCTFVENVDLEGAVEQWLATLEQAMIQGVSKHLQGSLQGYKGKKEKWIKEWHGQLLITTGAINWTMDCGKALLAIAGGNKNAMRQLKKKQIGYISRCTDFVRGNLTKLERNKTVSLITMEIHNRDVMERMVKSNCSNVQDFEWLSQLRFQYNKDEGKFGTCVVKQTNCILEYSYEYQGNNGRLVVTPLTDRCVLTLLTAMFLSRGGNPLGPAGTGKTETVKDLGKNLAKYVVVSNCSDGMDYKSVGRIFSGLVQSGAWGCFDEFNRIKIEVISVVAMQVLSITDALSKKLPSFSFMGQMIQCNRNCGIFITMNPGYAGRTELPDNLKALMRPVAMMVPDLAMIAEVILAAEGFREARLLAKKTITLYNLMIQQLSKQDHYDYGLRNLKAVLNMAGSLKRADPDMNEEAILMRALRDMNLPKFIKDDERLFRLLLGDLFPSLELQMSDLGPMQAPIERELERANLQKHPFLLFKIGQLYDSQATRHCNMMVGRTGAGKSACWQTLAKAKTAMAKEDKAEGYNVVNRFVINSKAISLTELYGAYDLATFEWADGILSTIFKAAAESDKPDEKWIMFDGPVDALWIESMNSVMDDNKLLTLINGDRIPLTNSMTLLFEVEDLAVASPATVSRAGMIFMDVVEMGFMPFVQSWLESRFGADAEALGFHKDLFEKYVPKILTYKMLNCREEVPIDDFNAVQSLCLFYSALATVENGVDKESNPQGYNAICEKWFVFSLIWSVCGGVDEEGRIKLDTFLRDIEAQFPPMGRVYDYYIDLKKMDWEPWESQMRSWIPSPGMTFDKMIVPTVDTVRNGFVLNTLVAAKRYALIVGNTGTGKTVLCQNMLASLPEGKNQLTMNFSAATGSFATQEIIEGVMEKRSKDKMGPMGGKSLVVFIDDFNMPTRISLESPFQPALELVRLWMDYGGWYDRIKCVWRYILDTQVVAAMAPPSGGRAVISKRTQARFHLVNCTFPDTAQVIRIFESILTPKLANFEAEVKTMGKAMASATLAVYKSVTEQFLPTPEKFHYLFNIRDVSKVVQGVLQADRLYIDTREDILKLWAHENMRVYADRFTDRVGDTKRFCEIASDKMKEFLEEDWSSLMGETPDPDQGPVMCSFMLDYDAAGSEPLPYQEVTDMDKLRSTTEDKLEDYNMEPKNISMDLVMFDDAIRHVCRIVRILRLSRGNAMLVGVGGSGRQSLARLSTFICEFKLFEITITKQYRMVEFHDDMKKLYIQTGVDGKATTFLFNDTQIKDEGFLEDVNNVLSSGEIPNLFGKDEFGEIFDGLRKPASKLGMEETPDNLWRLFIERVRSNLHIVLAMSPVGESLRTRCRFYPGLVNCTTIDWFHAWPADALTAVGKKFLANVPLPDDTMRESVARVFSIIHLSSTHASDRMLKELKRNNYITPTQFLELVKGYSELFDEKRSELSDAANKLANGLAKLEESKEQVEVMSGELELKKVVVAQSQKDCEELLVMIVSERRDADEKKKSVEADQLRIGKEADECNKIAADAKADLDVAMPALEKAMKEVDKLTKGEVSEIKQFSSPPPAVNQVLTAVAVLFGKGGGDWATLKKNTVGDANFLTNVKHFDKDNVADGKLKKLHKFIIDPAFAPDAVKKVSSAAAALCIWCHAIDIYSKVAKEVEPKRNMLKKSQNQLQVKQKALKVAEDALAIVIAKLDELNAQYDKSVGEKNALRDEAEMLMNKLATAEKLIGGLGGEYTRWQNSIAGFRASIEFSIGDSLVASGFLSYLGAFDTSYRASITEGWLKELLENKIPFTENYDFAKFLAKPTDVRQWNIDGLPADAFSTENGVIVSRSLRWPLMVDPQGQANKWIRNMEGADLKVIDLKMKSMLTTVENAIQFGSPVLLQDVLEELDPSLEPVLAKAIMKIGNRKVLKLGDKDLDYNEDFRLYITTKMGNPHYTPEVATKTTIVNFAVKQQGLEAQLLSTIVQKEKPSLEKEKSELVVKVAAGKKQLVDLENKILKLLSESTGSLLDDDDLVETLQVSKVTSEEVNEQLKVAEEKELIINQSRVEYTSASVRAAIAYFVLNDMARVDPMYQFSLDAYVDLFNLSIDSSRGTDEISVAERCKVINDYHTLAVYNYTCRGLFERHKLLFSFQLCTRIMERDNKIQKAEFDFFCFGGVVVDRSDQRPNPCPDWIDANTWDNIAELDKMPQFMGIASAFDQGPRDWKNWYMSAKPESEPLPGDWENKCSNELQRMCILRSLRPDRVLFSATSFVSQNLGQAYADPPAFDLKVIYSTSSIYTPLIFVLSPGVDPTAQVMQLSDQIGVSMENCALGQGQEPVALGMVERGVQTGSWAFLANCHLMITFMPVLEKVIDNYVESETPPHPNFRLWLSSSPNPHFPIAVLQRGVKMTTEPPSGLRANMLKLYNTVTDEQFGRCGMVFKYKKLLFALAWFHAILLERRKFKSLGFNIPYEFNESDFAICHDLIIVFLDEYPDRTPIEAMRYLIAEANYGGRVTDGMDRRLVNVYISNFICEDAIGMEEYPLSELDAYVVPPDGDLESYKDAIKLFPQNDHPGAFGQHPNADISSQIDDTNVLLNTIISLQPKVIKEGEATPEEKIMEQASKMAEQVPPVFNMRDTKMTMDARSDPDPLKTVLYQECDRYNLLLAKLHRELKDITLAVQGLVIVTPELEMTMDALLDFKVPTAWAFAYPSLKPLASWFRDLAKRTGTFSDWIGSAMPKVFWVPAFTYPSGYNTALLQTSARKNGIPIDTLSWEFPILNQEPEAIAQAAKEGSYVCGLFLEGARWDLDSGCLSQPLPMELFSAMPVIHFKPVESKKKGSKGIYSCPIYLYPFRSGSRERPSFVISADVKAGSQTNDFWVKRGVAMVLSTAV